MKLQKAIKLYYLRNIKRLKSLKKDLPRLNLLSRYMGNYNIIKISPEMIEEIFVLPRLEDVSAATVNRDIHKLSAVFEYFIKMNKIKINPVRNIKILKEDERETITYSREESIKMMETSSPIQGMVICGFTTGMRYEKIRSLQKKHINFTERYINCYRNTKTGKGRTIPIMLPFWEWIVINNIENLEENDYIFTNITKKPFKYCRSQLDIHMQKADVKILPGRKWHAMRHTYATLMAREKVNLKIIQDLLGHSSIKTTERYIHVDLDMKRSATKNLFQFKE